MSRIPFTTRNADIIQRVGRGESISAVGRLHGVTRQRVSQIIHRYSDLRFERQRPGSNISPARREQIANRRRRVAHLLSQPGERTERQWVARVLGVSAGTITDDAKAMGWPPAIQPAVHGSKRMYNRGCRCRPCKDANNRAQREWQARKLGR